MMTVVRPPVVRMGAIRSDPESRWREQARCLTEDPEMFFPVGRGAVVYVRQREAVAICRQCPVISECLQWALAGELVEGIWGGTTEDEREELIRNRNRKRTS